MGLLENALSDLKTVFSPESWIHGIESTIDDPIGAARAVMSSYAALARDPIGSFEEHPIGTLAGLMPGMGPLGKFPVQRWANSSQDLFRDGGPMGMNSPHAWNLHAMTGNYSRGDMGGPDRFFPEDTDLMSRRPEDVLEGYTLGRVAQNPDLQMTGGMDGMPFRTDQLQTSRQELLRRMLQGGIG